MPEGPLASSFRDPSGFLFTHEGRLFRQVNRCYAEDYRLLRESGLLDTLLDKGLLIPHREASLGLAGDPAAIAVLEPEIIPFVSYPYEWCFTQLKDAALATLRIQELALSKRMILKDASAFNVQFQRGRPILIDTLSFTAYREGEPWVAYRQFCQHFLAPLALMARRDIRLGALLREHIDGVPLDLASRLLPGRTRLHPLLFMHLHAHAASQKKHADRQESGRTVRVSRRSLLGIVDSLRQAVQGLRWRPGERSGASTTTTRTTATVPSGTRRTSSPPFSTALALASCGTWAPITASSAAWPPTRAGSSSRRMSIRPRSSRTGCIADKASNRSCYLC